MINKKEIQKIGEHLGIEPQVIDKDWILGHFLNAMYAQKEVRKSFVFKGGTSLKKCYFEGYRFSEDLDFTLTDSNFQVDEKFIGRIMQYAAQKSGARFFLKSIKDQIHHDIPQGYEVSILFWGAHHKPNQHIPPPERWTTKIKIDISYSEKICLDPETRHIIHPYPDGTLITQAVLVYPIIEMVAEKFRALVQRNRPRDIYDLYYLSDIINPKDYKDIYNLLVRKSEWKNVKWNGKEDFTNTTKRRKLQRAWESSLAHHLPQDKLVDFDMAYSAVGSFVNKILKYQ